MHSKYKNLSFEDKLFYGVVDFIMLFVLLLVLIPIIQLVSASISEPKAVLQGQVMLIPKGFSLEGYKAVFQDGKVMTGYANSIAYTVVGTFLSIVVTIMLAYPLSRPDLVGGGFFMAMVTFTMLFAGGIIPTYILIRDIHLINSRWALLLPGMLNAYNVIIARTFFANSIPKELLEAARIDGIGNIGFIRRIVIPLSKSIIVVLALYYGVAIWNNWFSAYIYLSDVKKYPLQLILKEILFGNSTNMSASSGSSGDVGLDALSESIKYACIMLSCVPLWLAYPFLQKFFEKGVMIGSLKG